MPSYRIERAQQLPRPVDEVFEFFSNARNLEAITPDFLRFRVLTPDPIEMAAGTLLDYQLSLLGVPFRWRTRIELWEPGRRFVDVQLRGPYKRWHHRHEFVPRDGGTLVLDVVDYELPLGILGTLAHPNVIRPTLERIFDARRRETDRVLGPRSEIRASTEPSRHSTR